LGGTKDSTYSTTISLPTIALMHTHAHTLSLSHTHTHTHTHTKNVHINVAHNSTMMPFSDECSVSLCGVVEVQQSCSVLQCVAVYSSLHSVSRCAAVCCSMFSKSSPTSTTAITFIHTHQKWSFSKMSFLQSYHSPFTRRRYTFIKHVNVFKQFHKRYNTHRPLSHAREFMSSAASAVSGSCLAQRPQSI